MTPLERAMAGFEIALVGHPWVSVDTLLEEIAAGHALIWHGRNSDVFVRLDWPVIELGPSAGEVSEMEQEMLPQIEAWAAGQGFREIHVQSGRQGMSRVLRRHGYEEAAVILRKRLSGGTIQ